MQSPIQQALPVMRSRFAVHRCLSARLNDRYNVRLPGKWRCDIVGNSKNCRTLTFPIQKSDDLCAVSALRNDDKQRAIIQKPWHELDQLRRFRHHNRKAELDEFQMQWIQDVKRASHAGEYNPLITARGNAFSEMIQLLRSPESVGHVAYCSGLIQNVSQVRTLYECEICCHNWQLPGG
jgi:hypothetical protein